MKIKKRFGKLGGYLPKSIEDKPLDITIKEALDKDDSYFDTINDFFLIFDKSDKSFYLEFGIAGYCLIPLAMILISSENKTISYYILLIVLLLVASFFLFSYFKNPEKKIILDRKKGLFTYPNLMYFKPITVQFEDALVAYAVKNSGIVPGPPTLVAMHPNGFTSTTISHAEILETWYLYVWYMDKNRPLPPGTAFDPYREKDFERRKAAGFPKPLYHSTIPTPEATPEQQKQRELIGGW